MFWYNAIGLHWQPPWKQPRRLITAFTIRRPPRGKKIPSGLHAKYIVLFFSNNWFVKHSPDQVSLLKNSSQIVTHPFLVWSRGGVQGQEGRGWMWSEGLSVNGTPGLCMQDPLAFWYALFSFGCFGSWLKHVAPLVCGMWALSCCMWHLVPWPGIETRSLALGAPSLSHWATREVPWYVLLKPCFSFLFFFPQSFFIHLFPLLYFEVLYRCILCVLISF